MNRSLEIYVDGACSGNPGPAAIGVVIREKGKTVKEIALPIGDATNNIAEYSALVYALQEALLQKATHVKVYTDSELMFSQITGRYKIKNEGLKFLFEQAQHLAKAFKAFTIEHILREKNKDADKLASGVLKKKQANVVASLFDDGGEESPSSIG